MVAKLSLSQFDPEIYQAVKHETERQEFGLEMIPSENFVSEAILEANGSVLTNKYAEGLPHKRYYGGNEYVDIVEEVAIQRACQLFGAEFANVQPHSGAQANQEAYEAIISRGDTVMGMRLDQGGHLTHGSKVNFSGKNYNIVAYGVTPNEEIIDPQEVRDLALKHNPKLIICGASAYSRRIDFEMFRKVADEVGALLLADIAHYAGLVAAGCYPNPIPHCHIVTTTTHKTLRGPRSGLILAKKEFEKAINKSVFPGLQGGPHMHTIAAKAVCFKEAMLPEFKTYAQNVIKNAQALAAALTEQGFRIVSGGTDSHVMLVDLRPLKITGKDTQELLDKVGITCNKNTIPYDTEPPMTCSGIRLGTPALTTRGMGVEEMKTIAGMIYRVISSRDNPAKLESVRADVIELAKRFPLYAHRLVR